MALPVLQCPGILDKVNKGDELEVDVEAGTIKNMRTGEAMQAEETPWILLEIYHQGGMLGWVKSRRKEYKTLEQS